MILYWIYLSLFILAVVTPKLIRDDATYLREEDIESALIFSMGVFAVAITVAKEKQILRHVREIIMLKREKHDITRDLSDSYSYIGEANRKIDVLGGLLTRMPTMVESFQEGHREEVYRVLRGELSALLKKEPFIARVIDTGTGAVEREIRDGEANGAFRTIADGYLGLDRAAADENGYAVLRVLEDVGTRTAFLVTPRRNNDSGNEDLVRGVLSAVLAFHSLEVTCDRCLLEHKARATHETDRN